MSLEVTAQDAKMQVQPSLRDYGCEVPTPTLKR